jgi:hypothetical protein
MKNKIKGEADLKYTDVYLYIFRRFYGPENGKKNKGGFGYGKESAETPGL